MDKNKWIFEKVDQDDLDFNWILKIWVRNIETNDVKYCTWAWIKIDKKSFLIDDKTKFDNINWKEEINQLLPDWDWKDLSASLNQLLSNKYWIWKLANDLNWLQTENLFAEKQSMINISNEISSDNDSSFNFYVWSTEYVNSITYSNNYFLTITVNKNQSYFWTELDSMKFTSKTLLEEFIINFYKKKWINFLTRTEEKQSNYESYETKKQNSFISFLDNTMIELEYQQILLSLNNIKIIPESSFKPLNELNIENLNFANEALNYIGANKKKNIEIITFEAEMNENKLIYIADTDRDLKSIKTKFQFIRVISNIELVNASNSRWWTRFKLTLDNWKVIEKIKWDDLSFFLNLWLFIYSNKLNVPSFIKSLENLTFDIYKSNDKDIKDTLFKALLGRYQNISKEDIDSFWKYISGNISSLNILKLFPIEKIDSILRNDYYSIKFSKEEFIFFFEKELIRTYIGRINENLYNSNSWKELIKILVDSGIDYHDSFKRDNIFKLEYLLEKNDIKNLQIFNFSNLEKEKISTETLKKLTEKYIYISINCEYLNSLESLIENQNSYTYSQELLEFLLESPVINISNYLKNIIWNIKINNPSTFLDALSKSPLQFIALSDLLDLMQPLELKDSFLIKKLINLKIDSFVIRKILNKWNVSLENISTLNLEEISFLLDNNLIKNDDNVFSFIKKIKNLTELESKDTILLFSKIFKNQFPEGSLKKIEELNSNMKTSLESSNFLLKNWINVLEDYRDKLSSITDKSFFSIIKKQFKTINLEELNKKKEEVFNQLQNLKKSEELIIQDLNENLKIIEKEINKILNLRKEIANYSTINIWILEENLNSLNWQFILVKQNIISNIQSHSILLNSVKSFDSKENTLNEISLLSEINSIISTFTDIIKK